jgi:hypothetical protein
LHSGANAVSYDDLRAVQTPPGTDTHVPIPHNDQSVIVQLKSVYYHYCEMPKPVVDKWLAASSMGQFYNAKIKGSGKDGPYDCRNHRVPNY